MKPMDEWTSSDEESDGSEKPKVGDGGMIGHGKPLYAFWSGIYHPFHDGAGLCSPGRWPPYRRRSSKWGKVPEVREQLLRIIRDNTGSTERLACMMAVGRCEDSPFTEQMIKDGVEVMLSNMEINGAEKAQLRQIPNFQPFRLYLLATLAKELGDPDWRILCTATDSFASGVPVGTEGLPRTPAVYERKDQMAQAR